MIRKVLLSASLVAGLFPALTVLGQNPGAAPRQSFDQLLQAAEKAREESRDDEAIRLFRSALAETPDSEEALWFLGTVLFEKQQYAEARDLLRQFLTLRPDAGPAWALLGMSEYELRQYHRALDHLQRAIELGMGDRKELAKSVYYDVAILLTRFERYDDSLDLQMKMLTAEPQQPDLVLPAGLASLRLPYLPTEVPQSRHDLIELAGQAVTALLTQRQADAAARFKRMAEAYSTEQGVHFLYGAYLMQVHPDQAVGEFERELEISPTNVLARVRLAEQQIAQGELDRALTLAEQAIKIEPKHASAHMVAGEALLAKGNSEAGIKELEIAREDDPMNMRIHLHLLRAYAAAGRKEDAEREKKETEKLYRGSSSVTSQSLGESSHEPPASQ